MRKFFEKLKNIKIWVCVMIVLLVGSAVGALVAAIKIDRVDFIGALSGVSSFFVAVLTALYVYTTSKQIDVANKQLMEMKEERVTNEQPLIMLKNDRFEIERPNFYYTPCTGEYSFQSRYYYKVKLVNVSNFPALWIDVSAEILIPKNGKLLHKESIQHRINILTPNNESKEIDIMFAQDIDTSLFTALRELSTKQLPLIRLTLYYKNLCGGYFRVDEVRQLIPHKDVEENIRNWQTMIISSKTNHKESLDLLLKLPKEDEKKKELFQLVKENFQLKLGEGKDIEIQATEIPTLYKFSIISEETYKEETKDFHYPRHLHKVSECIEDKNDQL